ncbi:YajQ family cyclic di-GMP-binding protein [Corallococcus exiguus]|uniref:YajQ family cyclic di-GMP-binding protein n=1 Tax=Corallococcus TaxID=83461 RepID=UPI000EE39491|nr:MULTISPECIES: YajQ family cyclic di-GMP-binding protein [Corallococcus]NNB87943.1 YajQ family cyclic di-GMP-binding protein [Corallococcus exiguus]NNC05187.1 YajQ family cyclic di-GMP-binding protein [Corallococcus exiguus]NNC16971.1 YajQ family cyclic di-GMP-binding protein [Corallococcus exiguus]NPC52648.1 YajQ family cyclic di-GMP-binding protein [Corallococcus exiguus]RKH82470.1 YajQ family cyclic di-GMP-binding protein [Corallococcus sp. AB032C]
MPSFDVISKIDLAELDNAVNQTRKELSTRYDFQGVKAEIEIAPDHSSLTLKTNSEEKLQAAKEVLLGKLAKRGISLRVLEFGDIEKTGLSNVKQPIKLQQGIPVEKSKELIKVLKESKIKVQGSIQADQLRVTGKNRDDLQEAMALFRKEQDRLSLDMQFTNFRD